MRDTRSKQLTRIILAFITYFLLIHHVTFSQCLELVWSDEFDYTGLPDPNKWTFETGGNWYNNELQYYRDGTNNAEVMNGKLVITAKEESFGGNDYTSARMITFQNGGYWQYGKVEARIKLPYGQGIWPAFWMLGKNFETVPWPACGEIDIMEMIGGGDNDKTIHGTAHWEDYNSNHAYVGGSKTLSSGIYADDFHVFSMEWNAQQIKWFMDGIQYYSLDISSQDKSEFDAEFFIILNVAVGGDWPGNPDATTVFPQTMEIDYVRVYSSENYLKIVGPDEVYSAEQDLLYQLPYDPGSSYSWSVPAGAEITTPVDSNAVSVNWGCEEGTIACNITTACGNYELEYPVKLKEYQITGDHFFTDNQTGMAYSVPELSGNTYTWFVPPGATITSGQGTHSILLDMGTEEGQVKVEIENVCGKDTLVKHLLHPGQYPYPDPMKPHILPGTIYPVEFDYGGDGVAYHDNTAVNQGNASRQDEYVDTEWNDGGETIGYVLTGEWLEYTIQVDTPGVYFTELRVSSDMTTPGPMKILINGEDRLGNIPISYTGGWSSFVSIFPGQIQLYASDTLLRYEIVSGGFNIGRLRIVSYDPSLVREVSPDMIRIFPNPATDLVTVASPEVIHKIEIITLSGELVVMLSVDDYSSSFSVYGLKPGIYALRITTNVGKQMLRKIIKL